ncbi:hypothetical protein VTO73DRAFT_6168 [Trametes versicolor]
MEGKEAESVKTVDTEKSENKHLIGRINNLVSSDLANFENVGICVVFILVESPFQIALCIVFLYQILGWSAIVGLITMLVSLPLPGYLTKHIQGAQQEKMKRTNARVQTVTEMMGVIRMVKLFGWEPRMAERLDKKREEELVAVHKTKLLDLTINLFNFIIPVVIMMSTFFTYTELIDEFDDKDSEAAEGLSNTTPDDISDSVIGLRQAAFTWSKDVSPSEPLGGSRRRAFVLKIDDELVFQKGKINLITGATGTGKTSLLMALLVLEQCALKHDLNLFDAGDQTEVGEKGITLSGGQKARITLARAVYSSAKVLLLDDILAALDVHTSKWIVDRCLKGDLLQGRTVILVTHNVAIVSPVADFVVAMGSDGRILSQGSLASALERDSELLKEITQERTEIEKAQQEVTKSKLEAVEATNSTGKLVAEEMEDGHVGWTAFKLYIGNMSKRPLIFWLIYLSAQVMRHVFVNVQYETHPPSEVQVGHYLTVYTLLVVAGMAAASFCMVYYVFGSLRSVRIVHQKLVTSVLGTTLRWLDKTPTVRIIAQCTGDIQTLDVGIAGATEQFVDSTIYMLLKMFAVVLFSPIFVVPAIMVTLAGCACGNVFMKAKLSVKRELSNSKAPVLSHFGAAMSGITSVRAYGAQEAFKNIAYARIDRYTRVAVTHQNLDRWIWARIDLIGTIFATSLAIYLTYIAKMNASDTGFSLNMATAFSTVIFRVILEFNQVQVAGRQQVQSPSRKSHQFDGTDHASCSLERIQQYLRIEHEPKNIPEGVPPAYWPASGSLSVEKLSARYSEDSSKVLQDVSFEVASGERVGIVGRTGSGKSSLTLSLLRCILTEGNIRYDGLLTNKVNLDALRSNMTIIPQVPELLSGTLRQNLDPFSEHDDAVLNSALRSAGLFNLQNEDDQSRITLDTEIAGGGANLSVGQRQILALARAIVRRSKLLILDEATFAIDYETDSVIQTSLRSELGKDVTLLTVAHRLQTIMDADKTCGCWRGCARPARFHPNIMSPDHSHSRPRSPVTTSSRTRRDYPTLLIDAPPLWPLPLALFAPSLSQFAPPSPSAVKKEERR